MGVKRHQKLGRWTYIGMRNKYPVHWIGFVGIHKRHRERGRALGPEFSRDIQGFWNFIEEIGPVPKGMNRPTVGQINHRKGYIAGNFRWESHYDNTQESAIRNRKGEKLQQAARLRKKEKIGAGREAKAQKLEWYEPDFRDEREELTMTAKILGRSRASLERDTKTGRMQPLTDAEWSKLRSDSWGTTTMAKVYLAIPAKDHWIVKEVERVVRKRAGSLAAPALVRIEGKWTVIVGEIRLMVCRALRVRPIVRMSGR